MEETSEPKTFDHAKAGTADRIALISELEHARRHCLRSAITLLLEDNRDDAFKFLVWAKQFQQMRRNYMSKHFADIDTKHWCLCKSTACLRQLAYEVDGGDGDFIAEIDTIVDEVWESATGEDLSDCSACREDKKEAS